MTGCGATKMVSIMVIVIITAYCIGGTGSTGKLIEVKNWETDTFVSIELALCVCLCSGNSVV